MSWQVQYQNHQYLSLREDYLSVQLFGFEISHVLLHCTCGLNIIQQLLIVCSILIALKDYNSWGFCNGNELSSDVPSSNIIEKWWKAVVNFNNHTYKHMHVNMILLKIVFVNKPHFTLLWDYNYGQNVNCINVIYLESCKVFELTPHGNLIKNAIPIKNKWN